MNQDGKCEAYVELIGLEKECPGFTTDPAWKEKLELDVMEYALRRGKEWQDLP